ncbi:MAG: lanthionine synthetase C family protein [Candidatus Aminicenantes bacterium]|nr:lanthionine synthetase C family protein [Candidatus Aminicenantes bacterium]
MRNLKWKKIIEASEEGKYVEKLSEIAEVVAKEPKKSEGRIDLMGGKVGAALFLFYYANYVKKETYYDQGMELLNEVFDNINEGALYHSFAGGLAGVGWTVDHLIKKDFIDADSDDLLSDLDDFLYKMMISEIKEKNYDFLHGALGIGVYFLSRADKKKTKEYLSELIDWLEKISFEDKGGGLKWISVLNRDENIEGFNLSLSHGVSSIIAFLAKMIDAGVYKDKAATLLEGAVTFLLHQSLDTGKFFSNFPSWVADDPPVQSRLAWCYGDLGNAIALWHASQSTGSKTWQDKAVDVILHAAKRRDIKKNMVFDAGICHGGAGISHIFNRMYHYTGNKECKDTALYWYDQTLKFATYKDGFAGFKVWRTEEYGGWIKEYGLLEGVSGIGLALISAISDIEPAWDRSLLIS